MRSHHVTNEGKRHAMTQEAEGYRTVLVARNLTSLDMEKGRCTRRSPERKNGRPRGSYKLPVLKTD